MFSCNVADVMYKHSYKVTSTVTQEDTKNKCRQLSPLQGNRDHQMKLVL